jgi:hypothetical protein
MSFLLAAVAGQGGIVVPGAPGTLSLAAGSPSDTVIALSWSAPSDTGGGTVSGYQIKKDGSVLVADTGSTGTTYSATGLTGSTSYSFTVAAINEAGAGADGNTPSLTTHAPFPVATGGTITTHGNYKAHTFTASGSLVFSTGGAVDVLSIAGGGGSSTRGAGGAGGMQVQSATAAATTYTVTIGAGGSGNLPGNTTTLDGALAFSTASVGGGKFAGVGGSGGGGGGTGGAGTAGQGNAGGIEAISSGAYMGGAGGGKGAVGGNASWAGWSGYGGVGGAGATNDYRLGSNETFAGGGGGGSQSGVAPNTGTGGAGGAGGGGAGSSRAFSGAITNGVSGTANTGGGAGGAVGGTNTDGGSGRVTVRYQYQ